MARCETDMGTPPETFESLHCHIRCAVSTEMEDRSEKRQRGGARVRGALKVMCHLTFGLLAQTS
jgi:hypothetical protein